MAATTVRPTQAERARTLPGDDIIPHPDVVMDRAFTVGGTPDEVWPWFVQLGKNRAGWYLPHTIELLIPRKRQGLRSIDASLQDRRVGDVIDDWGGRDAYVELASIDPPRALVYRSRRGETFLSWAIVLHPVGVSTRVQLRLRLAPVRRRWLARSVGELMDMLTAAGLAAGLRERLKAGH